MKFYCRKQVLFGENVSILEKAPIGMRRNFYYRKDFYHEKEGLLWQTFLVRKKFSYRKQVQRFSYEKAILLWKKKFYYKNQKLNYEKESLLWKKGVYNQTEVLYVSRFLLGKTILL